MGCILNLVTWKPITDDEMFRKIDQLEELSQNSKIEFASALTRIGQIYYQGKLRRDTKECS
jgi:hypothetical protein